MVIVPLQCEYLALRALKQLQKIIGKVRRKANPQLEVRILRTLYDSRTTHGREVFEEIAQAGGEQVLRTFIRRTVKFADAARCSEPILQHATDPRQHTPPKQHRANMAEDGLKSADKATFLAQPLVTASVPAASWGEKR
jgi:cellulose biosynthesis protein BcsQ